MRDGQPNCPQDVCDKRNTAIGRSVHFFGDFYCRDLP